MLPILGLLIVVVAVTGGYLLEEGELRVLLQPAEFVIIWGAAAGSLAVSTPRPVLRRIARDAAKVFRPSRYDKPLYLETLKLFHELFQKARKTGMMGLEPDVENPADSDIFNRYRRFTADKQAVHFVCDTLRVAVSGGIPPFDLDQMIDVDLETHEQHADQPAHSLATIADALPGLGIVAAVLGIVISMSSLGGPPEELGFKVASALVGTFLGVLTSYGFVSPIASAMQARHETESAYFRTLKAGLIAFVKGHPPILALEFARRAIPPDVRPTFKEMESKCRSS